MNALYTKIGEHSIGMTFTTNRFIPFCMKNFQELNEPFKPDLKIIIEDGYGISFAGYKVECITEFNQVVYRRADYLIQVDPVYKHATIKVYDELALKHALMNLYSSFIVYHNWGLLIHSSCAVEDGKAHIFAGHSGAGKSTAAKLSQPRELLSDEATLVKIVQGEITVFNSPFRSEINSTRYKHPAPLDSIQILKQSLENKRLNIKKADALMHLMDKIFYWNHHVEETKRIIGLLSILVEDVPAYELYFKKDSTFWELIS